LKSKKTIIIIVLIIIIIGYIFGYRLTSYHAAQRYLSSFEKDKTSEVLIDKDYAWGKIYLFDTGESKQVVIVKKYGPIWVSKEGFYSYISDEEVKTLGWASNKECTFLAIEVLDSKVSYIEAGTYENQLKQTVKSDELMVFSWDKALRWNDIEGKAYSKNGELLYEYRYPISNVIHMNELRWYPLEK